MIILKDFPAISLVTPKPIPLLAPVTIIVLSYSAIFFISGVISFYFMIYLFIIFKWNIAADLKRINN